MSEPRVYPEGYFILVWMAIGIPLGIPYGFILGEDGFIGVGVGIGTAIGLSIGAGVEAKYKRRGQIRPLTADEKRRRIWYGIIGITALTILAAIAVARYASD